MATDSDGRRGRLTGRDTLDTATTRETTDGGLGYALDVVTENLAVTLCAAFAEAFATFSAWVGMLADVCCLECDTGNEVGCRDARE